jgi:hypothetical protein
MISLKIRISRLIAKLVSLFGRGMVVSVAAIVAIAS